MSEEITKSTILESIKTERKRFDATLSALSNDQLIIPEFDRGWSVKDILIHIVVWEQRLIHRLEAIAQGEDSPSFPSDITSDDIDRLNKEDYEKHREDPLEDVVLQSQKSFQQVLEAVEAISEAALIDPDRSTEGENHPLEELVAPDTYWHYREHREQIEGRFGVDK
ncbi:MAG: ClbS/DfsB family four-helix bundle protein [Anaerolineales bacterium]|nr:ClbS/DfsB family four-helix bundle protein [Anaerolineales bacterium]